MAGAGVSWCEEDRVTVIESYQSRGLRGLYRRERVSKDANIWFVQEVSIGKERGNVFYLCRKERPILCG